MRYRKGLATAVVVALCVITTAQCTTSPHPNSNLGLPKLSLELPKLSFDGDSITDQSAAAIMAYFGRVTTPATSARSKQVYDVTIHAKAGASTYTRAPYIVAEAALKPDIELINLGTNDANKIAGTGSATNPPQTLGQVTDRLTMFATRTFPKPTCVIFVNVNTHNRDWSPANSKAIDDFFRRNRHIFPRVVDWNSAWQARYFDPNRAKGGTAANPDNPHPNELGRQVLLGLEDQAIRSCPPRPRS